jgi:hypothetical protein
MMKTYLIAACLVMGGCSVSETQKLQSKTGQMPPKIEERVTARVSTSRGSAAFHPPYVPPRGPTYGAAAVVPRNLTQGKIPYGSR